MLLLSRTDNWGRLKEGVHGIPTQQSSLTVSLPLFTVKPQSDCQKKQAESQSSSSLSPQIRCKPDGSYSDVQCDKSTDECWCVNKNGEEVLGTRSLGVVKCYATGRVLSWNTFPSKTTTLHLEQLSWDTSFLSRTVLLSTVDYTTCADSFTTFVVRKTRFFYTL